MTSLAAGPVAPARPHTDHGLLPSTATRSPVADGGAPAGAGDGTARGAGSASMVRAALGADAFARLHPALQRFHALQGRVGLQGHATTAPPAGLLARLLGGLLGTPLQARTGPVAFVLEAGPRQERWTRHFPGRTMRSRLRLQPDGRIAERLGPARLVFRLQVTDGGLAMHLQSLHFAGVPCPGWLRPRVVAEERGTDAAGNSGARLHFDVRAAVPLLGMVARYHGWLDLATAEVLA